MRLEELLGKCVRYEREEGHVIEGECAAEAYVVIMTRTLGDSPPSLGRVAQSEWEKIEIIA